MFEGNRDAAMDYIIMEVMMRQNYHRGKGKKNDESYDLLEVRPSSETHPRQIIYNVRSYIQLLCIKSQIN